VWYIKDLILSGETNDYIIGIYSFLAQHAALRSKTDWFSQNNVSG